MRHLVKGLNKAQNVYFSYALPNMKMKPSKKHIKILKSLKNVNLLYQLPTQLLTYTYERGKTITLFFNKNDKASVFL